MNKKVTQIVGYFGIFLLMFNTLNAQTKFIENKGQWPEQVLFRGEIDHGHVYIEKQAITYQLWDKEMIKHIHDGTATSDFVNFHALKLNLLSSSHHPSVETNNPFSGEYNFIKGDNPKYWAVGARAYQEIVLRNVYPQIDLKIEATETAFKYSFIVQPNGNPEQIKWQVQGANELAIDNQRLIINNSISTIIEEAPYCFQKIGLEEQEIQSQFEFVEADNIFRVKTADYNPMQPLVIDPNVIFSSLSNSVSDNWGFTATYDEEGNAYTGGIVFESDYPVTFGAFQRNWRGGTGALARDCSFYKLSPDGVNLIFSTFFGGSGNEQPHSMVVNSVNQLVVMGTTESTDFPTLNPAQTGNRGNTDMFVSVFQANGRGLIGSTYLGGTGIDGVNGSYQQENGPNYRNNNLLVYNYGDIYRGEVIVDKEDYIYVASSTLSSNFPTTPQAYQRTNRGLQDAVVVKLNSAAGRLEWSTYIGGTNHDAAFSIDVEENGNVLITGGTKGGGFPVTSNSYQTTYQGGSADAYILRLSADGSNLLNGSLLGTNNYDQGYFVKIGPLGFPWVMGQSEGSFPTKGTTNNANIGVFITQMNKDLSDIQRSRIIGSGNRVNISPSAFTVDKCGRIYFSGWGALSDFTSTGNTTGLPTTPDAAQRNTDGRDFYIAVYTNDLKDLIYGTFWGGDFERGEHVDGGTSRFDKRGVIYQAICAACGTGSNSNRFPTYPSNVFGHANNHNVNTNCNNAIVKIDLEGPAIFAEFEHPEIICRLPQTIEFTNLTQGATAFEWIMGDGKTYTDSNVTHTYTSAGSYTVKLVAYNPISCNLRDTMEVVLDIYGEAEADFITDLNYCEKEISFTRTGSFGQLFKWDFGDGNISREGDPTHRFIREGKYRVLLIVDEGTDCEDTFSVLVNIEEPTNLFSLTLDTCSMEISTINSSKGYQNMEWDFGDGNQSNDVNPTYQYNNRGVYTVRLTTNSGLSCEETSEKQVTIIEPEASFEVTIDTCYFTANFLNTSLDANSYKWDLGNGQQLTTDQATAVYPKGDSTYTVELIAAPFSQCADTLELDLYIPGLPVADFSVENDTCLSGAFFTNNSQNALSFLWKFGNGDSSRLKNLFYNYRDTGVFTVQLIALPYQDCADTFSLVVDIDTFRFAEFNLSLDTCLFLVEFKNISEDLDLFEWEFGDGAFSFDENPSYTYSSSGNFTIRMDALKSKNGCVDSFEYDLYIPPLPEIDYEQTTDSCFNTLIFKDLSAFGTKRIWTSSTKDFGSDSIFRVNFPRIGTYEVQLIVQSEYSCFDTLIVPIEIDTLPTASFTIEIDSCIGAIQFNDNSLGSFKSFWDFADGNSSIAINPYHNFENVGLYQVYLIINEGTECEDTLVKEVEITEYLATQIEIPNVFTPNDDGVNDFFKINNLRTDCDDYEIYIYNRWGVLVFSDFGNNIIWDGSNVNEAFLKNETPMAASSVYFYIFKSREYEKHGTIQILR